uniref:Secreted protein n=1 Tax=Strongyloides papillosus TaxID=174720 RepID=A0A0N5CIL8_STREA
MPAMIARFLWKSTSEPLLKDLMICPFQGDEVFFFIWGCNSANCEQSLLLLPLEYSDLKDRFEVGHCGWGYYFSSWWCCWVNSVVMNIGGCGGAVGSTALL